MSDRLRYRPVTLPQMYLVCVRKMVSSHLSCLVGKGLQSILGYLEMQCHDLLV
ncbi:hypothetical protein IC582_019244 [Cucumis melo]